MIPFVSVKELKSVSINNCVTKESISSIYICGFQRMTKLQDIVITSCIYQYRRICARTFLFFSVRLQNFWLKK